ncbi:MAG: sel1 repeat family protein, partial [Candidatus Methanomethylophilaceae archaeon]|nr:sel1 repeat family protein [Candidatus Methanomethylophilaceae archaeon]
LCQEAVSIFFDKPAEAYELFREAALQGYPNAFFGIAEMKMSGLLEEPDPEAAAELYRIAAEAGHPPSMYRLGMLYSGPAGYAENPEECRKWMKAAADSGMREAFSEIADILLCGYGGPEDPAGARGYLEKSAEQDAVSAFKLGCLYADGVGTEADAGKSVGYFVSAAERGVPEAQYKVGTMVRDGLIESPVPAEQWFGKASDSGFAAASFALANMYYEGAGVGKDPEKAFSLYSRAAGSGDADALFMKARMMFSGIGTEKNTEEALKLFAESASRGNRYSQEFIETVMRGQNAQIIKIDGAK